MTLLTDELDLTRVSEVLMGLDFVESMGLSTAVSAGIILRSGVRYYVKPSGFERDEIDNGVFVADIFDLAPTSVIGEDDSLKILRESGEFNSSVSFRLDYPENYRDIVHSSKFEKRALEFLSSRSLEGYIKVSDGIIYSLASTVMAAANNAYRVSNMTKTICSVIAQENENELVGDIVFDFFDR